MPIIVALVVLVAVIYGAIWSFHEISAAFGFGVALGAAIVAGLIVVAVAAYFWFRWKEVAPNVRDGDWTHEIKGDWGGVRVAAVKRLCEIRVGERTGMYIFADLRGARMEAGSAGQAWQVVLDVADTTQAKWVLPMRDRREAHKWSRILQKATDQKL
ncbi:hypothetical protein [Caballeronia sordidicola]|uniref:Putative signal peptide transmembrane protein n=1 Tax=Caballeronia sordidicola TaxID=196367 RepID=A0A242MQP7_CABSO|nr:hypothetical protein [Caballeronia sordidicola]OTP73647.1 putative signal peptide transmembrane protein [Caballeronia sordidicola]